MNKQQQQQQQERIVTLHHKQQLVLPFRNSGDTGANGATRESQNAMRLHDDESPEKLGLASQRCTR